MSLKKKTCRDLELEGNLSLGGQRQMRRGGTTHYLVWEWCPTSDVKLESKIQKWTFLAPLPGFILTPPIYTNPWRKEMQKPILPDPLSSGAHQGHNKTQGGCTKHHIQAHPTVFFLGKCEQMDWTGGMNGGRNARRLVPAPQSPVKHLDQFIPTPPPFTPTPWDFKKCVNACRSGPGATLGGQVCMSRKVAGHAQNEPNLKMGGGGKTAS